jgi:formate--tetrahydrofolate ligase
VSFSNNTAALLESFEQRGFSGLPVIVAKTQYSLSHDPKLLGRPKNFTLPIQDVRLAAGAGFVLAMTEGISLMPGLPKHPAAIHMDLLADGTIKGLKME